MVFNILKKGNKKFIMIDEKKKRRFTVKYKGSRKNRHIIMKDRRRKIIYSVYKEIYAKKPQFKIFSGEECILTGNCLNMFLDREMTFTFMGDIRYRLKNLNDGNGNMSVFDIFDERDSQSIGRINIKKDEKGERIFSVGVDDNYYRDYMVIFPVCLELSYYVNQD